MAARCSLISERLEANFDQVAWVTRDGESAPVIVDHAPEQVVSSRMVGFWYVRAEFGKLLPELPVQNRLGIRS